MEDEKIFHYQGEIKLGEYTISYKGEDIRVIETMNETEAKVILLSNRFMGEVYAEFTIKLGHKEIIVNDVCSDYLNQDGKNIEIIF